MIIWTEFNKTTGQILLAVSGTAPVPPAETATVGVLTNVLGNPITQYVDPSTRQLTPLPNPNVP